MSKLPALKPKEMARVARRLGFILDRQRGSHAIYLRATDNRRVVIPMHNHDLKPGTLHGLLRDLGITGEELSELL